MANQHARLLEFGCASEPVAAFVVEQYELIVLCPDRGLNEIGGEKRQLFAAALSLCMLLELLAFGGEADTKRRVRAACHGFEDVGIRCELELEHTAILLDLLFAEILDAIVRHGGHTYEYVSAADVHVHRVQHLLRSLYAD